MEGWRQECDTYTQSQGLMNKHYGRAQNEGITKAINKTKTCYDHLANLTGIPGKEMRSGHTI
jgi:hypothetical protein